MYMLWAYDDILMNEQALLIIVVFFNDTENTATQEDTPHEVCVCEYGEALFDNSDMMVMGETQ